MSTTRTSPAKERPGSNTSPGLSAAKVTVRSARHREAQALAGQSVDTRRDVDGHDPLSLSDRRGQIRTGQTRSESGIDHQINRPQRFGGVQRVNHRNPHSAASQVCSCHATVRAVVAWSSEHGHAPPVHPAHQLNGLSGDVARCSINQHFNRFWGSRVNRCHFGRE